jgi:hypothetical protein
MVLGRQAYRGSEIGSLADIRERIRDVRVVPRNRHVHRRHQCPLSTISERCGRRAVAGLVATQKNDTLCVRLVQNTYLSVSCYHLGGESS